VLQNIYDSLTPISRDHIDATTRGAFLSLTIMELRLSLRKWCPINGGVMRASKMKKRHAYREGDGYACHKIGHPDEKA
jgi:hypothetical protein